jgi:hypothetical protein
MGSAVQNAWMKGVLLVYILTGALALCSGCSSGKGNVLPPASRTVSVAVALALSKNVPIQISAIGTMEAHSTVSVKSKKECYHDDRFCTGCPEKRGKEI